MGWCCCMQPCLYWQLKWYWIFKWSVEKKYIFIHPSNQEAPCGPLPFNLMLWLSNSACFSVVLFRCAFKGTCPHLCLKIVTCVVSVLSSKESLRWVIVTCVNMALPVVLFGHSFPQSSILYCLIVCLAVVMRALFCCVHLSPFFARVSALFIFPWMFILLPAK